MSGQSLFYSNPVIVISGIGACVKKRTRSYAWQMLLPAGNAALATQVSSMANVRAEEVSHPNNIMVQKLMVC